MQIWKHIQSTGQTAADVFVELRDGQGLLKVRLAFDAEMSAGRKSLSSGGLSPSKFSVRRRKGGEEDSQ
jgi:hypothetical protein